VSLGLMPATGRLRLALDDRQRAALAIAANVAVSDEPPGGSPTGAPTGAVLYVAPLART
jgi:anti-sigma-K factor RskA